MPEGTLASNHGNQGYPSHGLRPDIILSTIEGKWRFSGVCCQRKELLGRWRFRAGEVSALLGLDDGTPV